MSALHDLARSASLQIDWEDAASRPQTVSDEALRRVLGALGLPAETDAQIARSLDAARVEAGECSFLSADAGCACVLPVDRAAGDTALLVLASGEEREIALEPCDGGMLAPGVDEAGYHRLHLGDRTFTLAVAPPRCFGVGDATPRERPWGAAVQVPSLRTSDERPFGDFGTLAASAEAFAKAGADALAISPTHALFPADASRYSPYAPSSRLFLNVLFGDLSLVGQRPQEGGSGDLVDWHAAIPARLAALRKAWDACPADIRERVRDWREGAGDDLERHATFDALHAHFFDSGARGWRDWPARFHDPAGPAVAGFAREHRAEVDFFAFAQWLARESLAAAQGSARRAGMAIGLVSDLAVGMDAGGSHAWSRPDDLLSGLSIGAPPDLLGPDGQDWGITGFAPAALLRTGFEGFIATLRAGLESAGGIRIDHALGLRRLWVVPRGQPSSEGVYLTFPLADMLRVLAIESHRGRAVVIGEDLGTVPEGLRPQLEARQVYGMRVLWFERGPDGGYTAPSRWQAQAVAMSGTHDLPTVAGWWSGRDIDWTWQLGRGSKADSEGAEREGRGAERARLWNALEASGSANGDPPAPDDTAPVVDAVVSHVAKTPCQLAIFPAEDLFGLVEQPNLPGTIDEHPNWQRRMPAPTQDLLADERIAARIAKVNKARP